MFQQLLLLYGLAAPLLFGGIPAALTYFLARARTPEERSGWVFDATVVLAALGGLFGVLLVVLRNPLAELLGEDGHFATALALLAPYAVGSFIAAVLPNALIPLGRARLSAALSALSAAVYLVCVIAAAVLEEDVRALAIAMGITGAFSAIVAVVTIARVVRYRRRWRGLPHRSRRFLAYGVPLALTGIAGLLGFQFDRLVVSAQFSPEVFAIYAVGAVELPVATIIAQSVNSVLLPELARLFRDGDLPGLGALWRETIRKTALILLPLFVICMVLADDLMQRRVRAQVRRERGHLPHLPAADAVARRHVRADPDGDRPHARELVGLVVVLGANVVLALALVGPLGIKGPALATVIATALTVAYYLVRLRGLLALPISVLFPWATVAKTLAVAGLSAVPVLPLLAVDMPHALRLVLVGAAYTVSAVVALRLTRRITDEDWARLRGQAQRLWPGRRLVGSSCSSECSASGTASFAVAPPASSSWMRSSSSASRWARTFVWSASRETASEKCSSSTRMKPNGDEEQRVRRVGDAERVARPRRARRCQTARPRRTSALNSHSSA